MNFEEIISLPWKEMVEKLLENGPKYCTWIETSDWVENNYSDEQRFLIIKRLFIDFDKFDKNFDCQEADDIRDEMDIFWRALSEEGKIQFSAWLKNQ